MWGRDYDSLSLRLCIIALQLGNLSWTEDRTPPPRVHEGTNDHLPSHTAPGCPHHYLPSGSTSGFSGCQRTPKQNPKTLKGFMFNHGTQESVLVNTLQSWCEKKKMTLGQVVGRPREMVPCGHKLRIRVGRV